MIEITDKKNCCGCAACVQRCPKHCITLQKDEEGFSYPRVDTSLCVLCGLCDSVCPVLHPYPKKEPQEFLAAINRDARVRNNSSSGGIFTLLAEQTIRHGGVVFGARFDPQWQVVIDAAETMEGIAAFQGSKYVQATVGNSFEQCKKHLDAGREVFFSGTSCQIAGLLHYLHKPYPNLLTCDFICHGVPSPDVWGRYLEEFTNKKGGVISSINFRDKTKGWKQFGLSIGFDSKKGHNSSLICFEKDLYMQTFLNNVILRPSCHVCPAKSGTSGADITLADFWGIGSTNPKMDDDLGTSLLIVNTDKGHKALPNESMDSVGIAKEVALYENPAFYVSAKVHPKRQLFFERMGNEPEITRLMAEVLRPTFKQRMKKLKKFIALQIIRLRQMSNN